MVKRKKATPVKPKESKTYKLLNELKEYYPDANRKMVIDKVIDTFKQNKVT